ncbi:hypothetical protein, partial [Plasmodium yoelii yoelii]
MHLLAPTCQHIRNWLFIWGYIYLFIKRKTKM